MDELNTLEAANALGVRPVTLRAWERSFGFPVARRSSPGERARFAAGEVLALRAQLSDRTPIAVAIGRAQQALYRPAGLHSV